MNKLTFTILLFFLAVCNSCAIQKSEEIKEILKIYANKNVKSDEFIYYKSLESLNQFKKIIGHPATIGSFTEVFDPVINVQIDTLISTEELNRLNSKLENYHPVEWDPDVLKNVPIIKDFDIPDFHFEGGIPKKGEEVVTVHYISTPVISDEIAIIFFSEITDPLNAFSGYYLLYKTMNTWKIVAENNVLITS